MTLAALAKAASNGEKPKKDLHVEFGKRLYKLVFEGKVGDLWREHRKEVGRNPLALVLRIDPESARFLLRLPWEYLHDEKGFLATSWRTPVYRLPWGVEAIGFPPLEETLRMLVVIASPSGLSENEVLHFAREEDLILAATADARKAGRLHLEFAPNGQLETVKDYLREYQPHLLHFVGHGVFVEAKDSGLLFMEDQHGRKCDVWNKDFADTLSQCRSLRGVFLSSCQSAVSARTDGFINLASHLLVEGIPLAVAMQYSVLNVSAMDFASVFYKGIIDGKLIEDTFTEARQKLKSESPNTVDFATPVLYLSDSDCLQVNLLNGEVTQTPLDLSGLTKAQNFVGRAVELRDLQTNLDPVHGKWRAAVVHAIGVMGKTVLAARLAERMMPHLDGVVSLRMTPSTTAQSVLGHIGDFLLAHNAVFKSSKAHTFQQARSTHMDLQSRAGLLAEALRSLKLLVVLDNCEDILPEGAQVSRAQQVDEETVGQDPELLPLISQLVGSVNGPSRFLFTSRKDFQVVEENRLADAIGHLALKEMGFRETVYLMETLPPLDTLPVAAIASSPFHSEEGADVRSITMRDVHTRLGGHPYRLSLFAKHASRSSINQVLDDLGNVDKEMLAFTLLERAIEQLPERAALVVERAAVFEEPVPVEGLAFMIGEPPDMMPDITPELSALLAWGLAASESGTQNYSLHSLVRDWCKQNWTEQSKKEYLRKAASYWLGVRNDSHDLSDHLRAHYYLFEAGDYEEADDIVSSATEPLMRWGQWGLLLHLLRQSVETLQGRSQAGALHNMAIVLQSLGAYKNALEFYQQSGKILEEIGDRAGVIYSLGQIGLLYQSLDNSKEAIKTTVKCLIMCIQLELPVETKRAVSQLLNLRSQSKDKEFDEALNESNLSDNARTMILQILEGQISKNSQEQPDIRKLLVNNTLLVLTEARDKKGEWWQALRKLASEAKQDHSELAAYAGALVRLIEGANPASLTETIPEEFQDDWQAILDGIG